MVATRRAPAAYLRGGAIAIYSPRSEEDRAADPYDRDSQAADYYSAVALGHQPAVWDLSDGSWGRGAAQGLYRTIASYVLELGCRHATGAVLEAGCGVGRTTYDCAAAMPGWSFVASDYAYRMCERAHDVLCGAEPIALASLAKRGFLTATLPARAPLGNVTVAQASVLDLPFEDGVFDCVVATLVIDRVAEPAAALKEMARVLAPEGRLVLSSPLNFRDPASWMSFGLRDGMLNLIGGAGLHVSAAFDGLSYHEIKDARGNGEEWRIAVCLAGHLKT